MLSLSSLVVAAVVILGLTSPVVSFQAICAPEDSLKSKPSSLCLSARGPGVQDGPASSSVSSQDLRSIKVTNVDGQKVPLGNAMGSGTSVVVFLRHLGCTWCWSYVYQWKQLQQELSEAGIDGPIFVSIGDEDRLNAFLLKNQEISPQKFFVDGYDFAAYKEAGFGRFDEKPKEVTENVKPKPAKFGGVKGWWTFMTSFIPLAPVTPDMKFPENLTPEGLFWVGGTFVVKGNDIVYRWDDRISGDHPEADEVLEIAKNAAMAVPPFRKPALPDFFGVLSGLSEG
jgi:hypothetical protein